MSRVSRLQLLDVHPDSGTLRLGHRVLTGGLGFALALLVMVGSCPARQYRRLLGPEP
jgi:hypothetical protein